MRCAGKGGGGAPPPQKKRYAFNLFNFENTIMNHADFDSR